MKVKVNTKHTGLCLGSTGELWEHCESCQGWAGQDSSGVKKNPQGMNWMEKRDWPRC